MNNTTTTERFINGGEKKTRRSRRSRKHRCDDARSVTTDLVVAVPVVRPTLSDRGGGSSGGIQGGSEGCGGRIPPIGYFSYAYTPSMIYPRRHDGIVLRS